MNTEPAVKLERVSIVRREGQFDILALKDVCLEVLRGSSLAVIGPSGSGKTALIRLIAGLQRPSSGRVLVEGTDLGSLSEDSLALWRARHVGVIFRSNNLISLLTVLENVELPLVFSDLAPGERRARAQAVLASLKLEHLRALYPKDLCRRDEQAVTVARAVVSKPVVVVADEPAADLDIPSTEWLLKLIASTKQTFNVSVVLASDDPRALAFADSALHIDRGLVTSRDYEELSRRERVALG